MAILEEVKSKSFCGTRPKAVTTPNRGRVDSATNQRNFFLLSGILRSWLSRFWVNIQDSLKLLCLLLATCCIFRLKRTLTETVILSNRIDGRSVKNTMRGDRSPMNGSRAVYY